MQLAGGNTKWGKTVLNSKVGSHREGGSHRKGWQPPKAAATEPAPSMSALARWQVPKGRPHQKVASSTSMSALALCTEIGGRRSSHRSVGSHRKGGSHRRSAGTEWSAATARAAATERSAQTARAS